MDGLKMGIDPADLIDDFNMLMYLAHSVLRDVNTVEVVKVQEVDTANKRLTVLPIVQRANASGNPIPEGPIYDVKYIEWQYGINAIKAIPAVGDIGIIVVCKKDTSSIESGLVGSFREFSLSDGIYLGGLKGFNQEPTQYIEFTENGITITTPKTLTVNTTENAVVNATGDLIVNGVNVEVNATTKATINSAAVYLGGEDGAVAIAKDGDEVRSGSTVVGTIKASSTVVKTI